MWRWIILSIVRLCRVYFSSTSWLYIQKITKQNRNDLRLVERATWQLQPQTGKDAELRRKQTRSTHIKKLPLRHWAKQSSVIISDRSRPFSVFSCKTRWHIIIPSLGLWGQQVIFQWKIFKSGKCYNLPSKFWLIQKHMKTEFRGLTSILCSEFWVCENLFNK